MTGTTSRQQHGAAPNSGLAFDDRGLMLGPGVIAWREEVGGYRIRPAAEIARTLRLAYGEDADDLVFRCARRLQRVVDLLKAGDAAQAGVQVALARLPAISAEGLAKLAAAEDLWRASDAYLTEDRVAAEESGAGEWTSDGGGGSDSSSSATAEDGVDPLQAKKTKFVRDYIVYARVAAAKLHVPVENILGVAALESQWGQSRFAIDGKNLFEMYSPAPYSHWSLPAKEPMGRDKSGRHALLAGYDSISDSFESFATKYADLLSNKRDPVAFATALQQTAKFGIDPKTGKPVKGYVSSVAATIRGLRPFVERTRNDGR